MTLGPLMVDVAGTSLDPADREVLKHPLVGGVILFTRNYAAPDQLTQLVAEIQALRSPALLVGVDHEGGRVQRFVPGFSKLPPMRRIGREFDFNPRAGLELARELGWLMAAELRAHGIDLSFAPVVDLDYGVNEAIGDRAFHPRAAVVGQLAVAWMHGMRTAGMAATAKHFPGHGAVVADSHVALPVDRRELVDLDADLAPYRILIENGLAGVMMAHVQFPAVDPGPAGFSRRWIQGVLRGELRFNGAVFSDDLSMEGAGTVGGILERARRALGAGCDMLLVCNSRPSVEILLADFVAPADPASSLRRVRLRGRDGLPRAELHASLAWQASQRALALCKAPPALKLEGDEA